MKKLICVLVLSFLVACTPEEIKSGFSNISGEDAITKVANKETFVLMITTGSCYSCDVFEDEIETEMKKNELIIYRLDYSDLSDDMKNQFELVFNHYSSWPAIVYVQGGELYDYAKYEYSQDPEGWREWFQKQSLIQTN